MRSCEPDTTAEVVADDMAAPGQMTLNNAACGRERILSRPSIELMTMDHLTPEQKAASPFLPNCWNDRGRGFGLGVISGRNDLSGVPGRFGWDRAFGTSWPVDPKEEMIGILMTRRRPDKPGIPAVTLDFWTSACPLIDERDHRVRRYPLDAAIAKW